MSVFNDIFTPPRLDFLRRSLKMALEEDGLDLTSRAIFRADELSHCTLVAKQAGILAGGPLLGLILAQGAEDGAPGWKIESCLPEGSRLQPGDLVASLSGQTWQLLRSERVILNYLCHLSGIATMTASYVRRLGTSPTKLLDTRKTLPGLRYLEKYAVRIGGGHNHRMDLSELILIKDNHIDRAGGIAQAIARVRDEYSPPPPIEVECRTSLEVQQAVRCQVNRIMLDNMDPETASQAIESVPAGIEVELSGGVKATDINQLGKLGATFISSGGLTHSAPALDLSIRFSPKTPTI